MMPLDNHHHHQNTPHPGIGKALAKRLADQGLNVVLVALPDDILETTYEQLVADYPSVQFRKVCLTHKHTYIQAVLLC